MIALTVPRVAFTLSVIALLGTASVNAGEPWADDGFLTDYSKLQPIPDKEGKDFVYVAPKTFADATKPIEFEAMVAAANELGERFACRLDNGRVQAPQRIDCTDPVARKARPKLVGL